MPINYDDGMLPPPANMGPIHSYAPQQPSIYQYLPQPGGLQNSIFEGYMGRNRVYAPQSVSGHYGTDYTGGGGGPAGGMPSGYGLGNGSMTGMPGGRIMQYIMHGY